MTYAVDPRKGRNLPLLIRLTSKKHSFGSLDIRILEGQNDQRRNNSGIRYARGTDRAGDASIAVARVCFGHLPYSVHTVCSAPSSRFQNWRSSRAGLFFHSPHHPPPNWW